MYQAKKLIIIAVDKSMKCYNVHLLRMLLCSQLVLLLMLLLGQAQGELMNRTVTGTCTMHGGQGDAEVNIIMLLATFHELYIYKVCVATSLTKCGRITIIHIMFYL